MNYMEIYEDMKDSGELANISNKLSNPSLKYTLDKIGHLPKEALFLGVSKDDDMPILLNLHDPQPGPLLVISQKENNFIRCAAKACDWMHSPSDVQYAIIGDYNKEGYGCCVGEFAHYHDSAYDLILSLSGWAHSRENRGQSVVLFINNLVDISKMNFDVRQTVHWMLLHGPRRRLWPIVIVNEKDVPDLENWVDGFHTVIRQLSNGNFMILEDREPLEFWIPEVEVE